MSKFLLFCCRQLALVFGFSGIPVLGPGGEQLTQVTGAGSQSSDLPCLPFFSLLLELK